MKPMNEADSANQKTNKESKTKTREEGELSSSDDDANPGSSFAHASGPIAYSAANDFATPANKNIQGTQMVKTVSSNNLASSVDIQPRTSFKPNSLKRFEQNRVTFKSNNPGWFPSLGTNTNLVISFSDDDSGSDTEDHRHKKAFQNEPNASGVDDKGRPPTSSVVKSKNLQRTARKVIPNKLSPNQTFISTTNRIHRGANSWVSRPLSVEQRSRARNFSINKNFGSQECASDQGVDLRNSKLQDLRQQIALRESELNLKAAQQNKDLTVDSCKNYFAVNLNNDATRKYQSTSTNIDWLEQKEPDKKRLKVSGSHSHQLTADGWQNIPAAKSIVPVKEPTLEKSSLHGRNKFDRSQKIFISRIGTDKVEQDKQSGKRVNVLPENVLSTVKDVANINTSCNQSDRDSRQVNTDLLLNSTAQLANVTSSNLQKNFVNDAGLWKCFGNANFLGHNNVHRQSLFDMEDLLDKELEEAQEHRRMCEIEERNALKAYRKAQRALVEANVGCTKLYHQREVLLAQLRSVIMDDSNLLWPSRQHESAGNELDLSKHISENMHLLHTPSHQMQSGFVGFSQGGYDASIQCVNGAPLNSSHDLENAQQLGSEPCSEPDASTSETLPLKSKNTVNGLSPRSNELNISADEDEEIYQLGHESVQRNFEYLQKDQISEGRQICTSNTKFSTNSSQDPLLLEAALRSELFARLGMRSLSKHSSSCFHVEPSGDQGADNDSGSNKMQMSNGSVPSSGGQNQQQDIGGTDEPERSIHESPIQIQDQFHVERSNLKSHITSDSRANRFYTKEIHSALSVLFSPPSVLRSAFGQLKSALDIALANQIGNRENHRRNFDIEVACVKSNETQDCNLISKSKLEAVNGYFEREIGSYTCNLAVDPFWPLCMYELRGKCNNDECPWQHVKDFSDGNMYQHDNSYSAGCQIGSTIHRENCTDVAKISNGHDILTLPTYIVDLDILKAELHSFESVVARRHGQCWQKCFSISLALSSMFQKDLSADVLHASDGRFEWHESWNGQSSYFQSRNGVMNQFKQTVVSHEQYVEMALLILNQEANKLESTKKALSLLSRALEADPTSELLWIIYLIISYSDIKSFGMDMFSYAVKQNEGSYGLWLMYINSRIQLNDRLAAYDAALSALCCRPSTSEGDQIHASACILDLFLQMMECLYMSGNIEKAIQRVSELFLIATDSNDHHSMFLSDILTCLTISDKLLFCVCCAYLVIYRKLPDAVLQQFECEKDLLAIEWPSVQLGDDEKRRAIKLIEMAVDSVEKYINSELQKSEINLRSVQNFAVSHIRCMAALDGLECFGNLLEKYMKLYPFCLELVLISARLQKLDFGDLSFVGFEEALSKWPKGVPGIQCIWNQYAEYALQNGRPGFAAELMDRWFHSVWKIQCSRVEISVPIVANMLIGLPKSTSTSNPDFSVSSKNKTDLMFGYLNLSLHKLLQNNCNEAHLAIEEALKAAAPDKFTHCVREHAMLLLIDESELKEDALIRWQLTLLNSYLDKVQSFSHFEPLPRAFINNI